MNRNQNIKTLEERKKDLDSLRTEWKEMKKQEEILKKQFYNSPFAEKAKIKSQLTRLQREIFDKDHLGRCRKSEIEKDELFQNFKNLTGEPTNPQYLANLIKEELRWTLDGSREVREGDRVGNYWEVSQGKKFWAFTNNKEIRKGIENLPRNRREEPNREKMSIRKTEVKRSDLDPADFNEIISLIRQVKNFLEEKDKQDRQKKISKLKNNPGFIFTHYESSTDPDYNGIGHWQDWHNFSGYHNGIKYTIKVPANHIALTNVLFNDGLGTNSEVRGYYVVEGVKAPTQLSYWNQAQQRTETISETEARRTGKKAYYENTVSLNDKITIRHYDEKSDKLLGTGEVDEVGVSGVNQELVENSDHKNMGGGLITNKVKKDKTSEEIDDNQFLLKYFQSKNIKRISLTPEGNLLVEYNSGKSETMFNEQVNNQELQRVITYYKNNNQTNLSQQDLINMNSTNAVPTKKPNNKAVWIYCGIGGILLIGTVAGLTLRKRKIKRG